MFHEVRILFEVVSCAAWRLPPVQLEKYLARLADRLKHEDVLTEFAPVLRLGAEVTLEHEVIENTSGNQTIDWSMQTPGHPKLLLEIKNRLGDLIESFEVFSRQGSDGPMPAPQHDHNLLFRSVQGKFAARSPSETIQAVWIRSGLKQETAELQQAFDSIDAGKLHAAVLAQWGPEANVLARDSQTKKQICKILRLRPTTGLTFSRS